MTTSDAQSVDRFVDLSGEPAHAALLDAFHGGIYWDAFGGRHEPLETWRRALRGELPYRLMIRLAIAAGDAIAGGIAYERYPRSGCGLVTFMVVAPGARRSGLGTSLLARAVAELHAGGAPIVFGEVIDPRAVTGAAAAAAWAVLERNQRAGARVLEARYVQPALGAELARDRRLLLIAMAGAAPLPAALDGAIVRAFVAELYAITEGGAPDPEIAIPDRVPLVEVRR